MLLATGDGAEGFIIFSVNVVAFALAGARDETVRMVSIYRQGKEGEAFPGAGQFFEFFPGLLQYGIVVEAPVVAVSGVGDGRF